MGVEASPPISIDIKFNPKDTVEALPPTSTDINNIVPPIPYSSKIHHNKNQPIISISPHSNNNYLVHTITGAIDVLQYYVIFTLFKISLQYDVLSGDPSCSHRYLYISLCTSRKFSLFCFSIAYLPFSYTFALLSVLSYFFCLSCSFVCLTQSPLNHAGVL